MKNLNHVYQPKSDTEGDVPHIFHQYGKLKRTKDTVTLPNNVTLPTDTDIARMTAYGTIAAGSSMVRYKSAANMSLSHSLRVAVGTQILKDVGVERQALPMNTPPNEVYYHAINAMTHWGTENQESVLEVAREFIKGYGLNYQAKILPALIETAISLAFQRKHRELDLLYKDFHALYGTEENPSPPRPDGQDGDESPEEEEQIQPFTAPPPANWKDTAEWGTLTDIRKLKMAPWKHPQHRTRRAWKYSEFGVFKYPWRALPSSDMRCFSLPRRQYGGTVLFDFSGSMNINNYEITAILMAAPYATIAAYGGYSYQNAHGSIITDVYGRIVILAENSMKGDVRDIGQRDHNNLFNGANTVDGPALRWLAQQEGPRIWVSDGLVVGKDSVQSQVLVDDCKNICAAANIIHIKSPAELIAQLRS